jgi:hypothetical protein
MLKRSLLTIVAALVAAAGVWLNAAPSSALQGLAVNVGQGPPDAARRPR